MSDIADGWSIKKTARTDGIRPDRKIIKYEVIGPDGRASTSTEVWFAHRTGQYHVHPGSTTNSITPGEAIMRGRALTRAAKLCHKLNEEIFSAS